MAHLEQYFKLFYALFNSNRSTQNVGCTFEPKFDWLLIEKVWTQSRTRTSPVNKMKNILFKFLTLKFDGSVTLDHAKVAS